MMEVPGTVDNLSLRPPSLYSEGSNSPYNRSRQSSTGRPGPKVLTAGDIYSLPEDGHLKYDLLEEIGQGTYGLVHRAVLTGKTEQFAIKIIEDFEENITEILQEYRILFDHSLHPNIPMLLGAYRCNKDVWFVMELCDYGPVSEIASALVSRGRRLIEDQIAYIIKETLHALIYLQLQLVCHRDVKGSNILLTEDCQVKLVDYGISCQLASEDDKRSSRVGTPYWMAPEVILCGDREAGVDYDGRCDTWSLGVTMIELAQGAPPLSHLHPMRALQEIARNPPPRLARPEEWSLNFNDVVTACLIKDHELRPVLQEVMEHPLFKLIPQHPSYIQRGLKSLITWLRKDQQSNSGAKREGEESVILEDDEMIRTENLAVSSEYLQTKKIAEALQKRLKNGKNYTYIGDILLAVDPKVENISELSIDESEPHVFNLCKNILNKMMHFHQDEILLTSGFSQSGKQNIYDSALQSLLELGKRNTLVCEKILAADRILSALVREKRTELSRSVRQTRLMFNRGGLVTGAKFQVSSVTSLADFTRHWSSLKIFDWVLCGLRQQGRVREFGLQHLLEEDLQDELDYQQNIDGFKDLVRDLSLLGFRPDIGMNLIFRIVVTILLLFKLTSILARDPKDAAQESVIAAISTNLEVDPDQLKSSLTSVNLSCSEKFRAEKSSPSSVSESLARLLYISLIDWVEDFINTQLDLSTRVYGVETAVTLLDTPGVESGHTSPHCPLSRLVVNTLNESLHWVVLKTQVEREAKEARREKLKVLYPELSYNTELVRELLGRTGLFSTISSFSRQRLEQDIHIPEHLETFQHIQYSDRVISIKHFWGDESYSLDQLVPDNECFVSPELIATLCSSSDDLIRAMFQSPVDSEGKTVFAREESEDPASKNHSLMESQQTVTVKFQYLVSSLLSLVMKTSPHFVFCFPASQDLSPQLEMFSIKELNFVRRTGFSHRPDFASFLLRYCFLAFEFDERVVATKETVQLLMIRLGVDGFHCGKRKIFLKYYHVDFLSRTYNQQYKRIVTVQSAARRYLAKIRAEREKCSRLAATLLVTKKIIRTWRGYKAGEHRVASVTVTRGQDKKYNTLERNKAATEIQRHVRGFTVRRRLSVGTRCQLMRVLASPSTDRETAASGILEDRGLERGEARAVLEDIQEAMENKEAIFTKKEAMRILPQLVREANLSVMNCLRRFREAEMLGKMRPVVLNFIQVEAVAGGRQKVLELDQEGMVVCRDISQFYSDPGPDRHLEKILEEVGRPDQEKSQLTSRHVLKERHTDLQQPPPPPVATVEVRQSSQKPVRARAGGPAVKVEQRRPQVGLSKIKPSAKWPEVKPCFVRDRNNPPPAPVNSVINQLNSLKNLQPQAEADGPFNFRKLLRKTSAAPTDSLRMRQNIQSFVQVLDGEIQVL